VSVSVSDRVVQAPNPAAVRAGTLDEMARLGVRLPPAQFPLVWDPGDTVTLRSTPALAARSAIIGVLLATVAGLPRRAAMRWLRDARLLERVTAPEWQFIAGGFGDPALINLEWDALHGLAWVLGLVDHLDPVLPRPAQLLRSLPDPWTHGGHSYPAWLARVRPGFRDPAEAAALLDLYYCLDWSYQDSQRWGRPTPGQVPPVAIGQRRWALEWSVVLRGPYQEFPPHWEHVDLSI
jgi:hypothetical protein